MADTKAIETEAPKNNAVVGADEVVVKRSILEGVLGRIEELEKTTRKTTVATPKVANERVAQVAFLDGLPVVEFGKFTTVMEDKEEVIWIDLVVQDGDKKKTERVKYVDFLRDAERRPGRIVDRKITPITMVQKDASGNPISVEKKYVDGFATKSTGKYVDAVVESIEQEFVLEFEDGLKLTMSDKYVNI